MANNKYTKETKIKVAKMRIEGYSISYIRNSIGLKSDAQVLTWTNKYLEHGEKAFDIDMRGKVLGEKRGRPKTKFSSLEEEIKYLKEIYK